MSKIKNISTALKAEIKEHKSSFIVYTILRIMVIATLVGQLINGNFESAFMCILVLLMLIVPSFIQITLKIELPTVLEIILLLFIFAAEILGEIYEFYIIFPHWDTMLHTMNGFLMAAVGFSMVNLLNNSDKMLFKLSPFFTVVVAFCFSMTIGVIWEFFEFSMDFFFDFDMQKDTILHQISTVVLDPAGGNTPVILKDINNMAVNGQNLPIDGYLDIGLYDTIADLVVNFIGAVVFSVLGFIYVKTQGKTKVVGSLIPTRKETKTTKETAKAD